MAREFRESEDHRVSLGAGARILFICFFLSSATALIYEVLRRSGLRGR